MEYKETMNETDHEITSCNDVIAWLQFNFKETPGTVCVNAKEVFTVLKQSNTQIDLSQHTLSCLVSNIFPSTTIHRKKRGIEYQGLQRKTAYDKACDTSEIDKIATDNKFFKIPDEECFKYGFMTGDCINKVEIMKIIEIKPDRTWRSIIAGKEIDKEVIGLSKLACYNFESVAIIFNTIRLARICRGKHVLRKLSARRTSYLQEWSQSNNESGIEMRLTSGNCHTILSFMATSDTCNVCSKQNISRSTLEHNTEVDLFKEHFPGATDLMLKMLKQQSEICKHDKDSRTVRWNKDIIQIALTLWNRSPQGYTTLRDSGALFLPSESLLRRYKNFVQQKPGINDEMFSWIYAESQRLNSENRGGLIIDEMSIQQDFDMCFNEGHIFIDGLTDMGQFSQDITVLNTHINKLNPASYILQFVYLGYDGFRFPIAYFPTAGATAPELYINVWEVINKLYETEITIDYVCFDGGSNNRKFQIMHFVDQEDALAKNYTTENPYRENQKVTLIMDYSHNIKKIRNNILSSGEYETSTRNLILDNKPVQWKHWIEAYNWDRNHNPMRVHQKLTDEHIFVTKVSKMRNHLAEEVLDKDMLHLMEKYKESKKDGSYLDSSLNVISHTSKLVEIFRDPRAISDVNDCRLQTLKDIDTWLQEWHDCVHKTNVATPEKAKQFISKETYNDIRSMLKGFIDICKRRISTHSRSIVPAGINSDIVENFFCQQRTICHGSTTNPSAHQYKYGINSTVLGQAAVSKKSNAAKRKRSLQPLPLAPNVKLKKKFPK